MRSSALRRRAGTAASASPGTPIPPKAATRPEADDTCSCRRSTPSSPGSAGSARARSTTSASGSPCRRRTRTAWRRSTPSCPRCRAPGGCCTSATTSPAGARARTQLCAELSERLDPPTTAPTATITNSPPMAPSGCGVRASACATRRRPRCSPSPAKPRSSDSLARSPPHRRHGVLAGDLSSAACPHPRLPQARRRRRFACSGGWTSSIPPSLDEYRANGGYQPLRRALDLGPEGVIREVIGRQADGTRWRGLPDRPEVGGRRATAGPARTT